MHIEPTPAPATPGTARADIILSLFKRLARKFIVFPATAAKCAGFRGAFDIEANGLHDATKLHCIAITDLDSDRIYEYGPNQISAALKRLSSTTYLTGHNICGYDLPTLQRLHNWTPPASCTILDTMVAARLILPNLEDIDDKIAAMSKTKVGKLRGRYSLEAFGVRLGISKVGADIGDWSEWTVKMQERCVADTKITKALWQFLQPDSYPAEALALEHRVSRICSRITADGAPFDVKAAKHRQRQWTERCTELGAQLKRQFPDTNLNSRKQLGALFEQHGWIPEERTEKTKQPKITDEVLETITMTLPKFAGLAEYDILRRRLAQLSDGDEAWSKHVDAHGKIHGGLVHIGTPHSRAKHLTPNLAQVPSAKRGKPFATECRSLFRAPGDWVFVCCDQAGLQDRAFAHYLAEYDAGAYAKAFLNGLDPHWKTAADLDLIAKDVVLDKQNKVHAAIRENSKSFRYAFLFGAGQSRAGHIINNTVRAAHAIDAGNDLQKKFFGTATRPSEATLKWIGKQALEKFVAGTPGLRRLRAQLSAQVERYGWLPGLDGRRVPARAQYTALNFQVTSAEAVITKRWLVNVYDELSQKYRYGWDGDCVIALWIHDEIAVCCRPEIADAIGAIMVKHAKEPGEFYKFKVPLDASYTIGKSWAGNPVETPQAEFHMRRIPEIEAPAPESLADKTKKPIRRRHKTTQQQEADDDAGHLDNERRPTVGDLRPNNSSSAELYFSNMSALSLARRISEPLGAGTSHEIDRIACPIHGGEDRNCAVYTDGHGHCFSRCGYIPADKMPAEADSARQPSQPSTDTLKRGIELWNAAKSIHGTPAERYLAETRKLDLAILSDIDAVLRFHPRCPFDKDKHPCVIALFRDVETDEVAGIHRIALTSNAEKIDRRMLGSWPNPRAIKLRPTGKKLIVGEGIETTLAGGMRASKTIALWAMGSAIAIGHLQPVTGVTKLMILVDRDKNDIGRSNARVCAARWSGAKCLCVLLCPQQEDTDFNNLIGRKS